MSSYCVLKTGSGTIRKFKNLYFMIDYLIDLDKHLKVLIMCLRSAFTIILFCFFNNYSYFIIAYQKGSEVFQ